MIETLRAPVPSFNFSCQPIEKWVERQALGAWKWSVRILDKHTDLILNVSILAITTCLAAGKIFKSIPAIIPRLAKVVFDFGGIFWLNIQVKDLIKSGHDLGKAFHEGEWAPIVETAVKVFVKGVNILLTCALFAASVSTAIAFPQASYVLGVAVRPLGLACLALTVATDIRDYFINESIIKELDRIEEEPRGSLMIAKTMACFLERIGGRPGCGFSRRWKGERRLADRIVRQLDTQTVETFHEVFARKNLCVEPRQEAWKLFYSVKDGIVSKQAGTKANLSLTVLGYISMGICRAFPDSLVEMSTRWLMSVLFTDELIRQKLFQYDLIAEAGGNG